MRTFAREPKYETTYRRAATFGGANSPQMQCMHFGSLMLASCVEHPNSVFSPRNAAPTAFAAV